MASFKKNKDAFEVEYGKKCARAKKVVDADADEAAKNEEE